MKAEVDRLLRQARTTGWVMEPAAKRILQAHRIPTTRWAWAHTLDEALQSAGEIGYPLVAKIVSPEVVHKSDVGGVIVGVENADGLRRAWDKLSGLAAFDGVLLDQMVEGVELIVGAKQDAQFGTVVLVGIGGTSVEVYQDVAIRMAPMRENDAHDALDALRGRKLLEGHRGAPAADRPTLVRLLVDFSAMAWELREMIESIDLNPVLCGPSSSIVADARFILAAESRATG